MDTPAALLRIAEAADHQIDPAGPVEHVRTDGGFFATLDDVDGRRASAFIPVTTEIWRAVDDSGRITVHHDEPQFDSPAHQRAWTTVARPPADATRPAATRYQHGDYPAAWHDRPPQEPVQLGRWLQRNQPALTALVAITAVADLFRERVLTGRERAAVIRVLAAVPGIEHFGRTTLDPVGEAFGVFADLPGPVTRHTIVLDSTGRLLVHEEVATAGTPTTDTPVVTRLERYVAADSASTTP